MISTKNIDIAQYDYLLPDEKIAKYPLENRDESKLLIYKFEKIEESIFSNLCDYIPSGSLMIFNNTRVIQARLKFVKDTGAKIEIFCLEPDAPSDYTLMFQQTKSCVWNCLVGNSARWKNGKLFLELQCDDKTIQLCAERVSSPASINKIQFSWNGDITFAQLLESAGELPIPPYLNRTTQESDKQNYQTVYSKIKGSVAAPTAGLHFTPALFEKLAQKGIKCSEVTLHVGAGTFKPVKSESLEGHEMHTEYIVVHREILEDLIKNGGRAIAVGTTSVRTLESLYYLGTIVINNPNIKEEQLYVKQWMPYEHDHNYTPVESLESLLDYMNRNNLELLHSHTQIIIAPGYKYKIVNMMITNFHQPRSTLLLLVSAFVNGNWESIYDYALNNEFRFLSYGDSSLLIP